jgi:ABC-type bacteriocin/lantibiotic exporter with double-glycine peptidase domain
MTVAVSRLARWCARSINRRPVVRQYDRVDCGPACLLSVLRFHGGDTSLPTVRSWSGTDANGTSLLGLQRAAARLGLRARGATGTYDELRKERLPCIAHVVHEGVQHYVVVYEVRGRRVRVGDPGRGLLWLQREEFERLWIQHAVLLLHPAGDLITEHPPHWFGWVLGRIRHVQAWLVQSVFLGVIYTVLGLATAVLVQRLIDDYIGGGDPMRILWAGGVLLAIHTGKGLVGYVRQRFLVGLGKWSSTAIASEFLEHLFRLPASYFDTRKRGDIIARLQDSSQIQTAVLDLVGSTTIDLLITIFSMAAVFYFSPPLGWIATVLLLPSALLAGMSTERIHKEQDAALGAYGHLHASYVDAVDGIDAIRGLGAGRAFARLNLMFFGRFQDRVERLGLTRAKIGVQVETVNGAMLATILTAGALLVASGDLKIGAMMASYSLVAGALPSLQGVIGSLFAFQGGAAAAQRLQDLLLTEPESSQGSSPFQMDTCLSLEDARFEWPNGGQVLMGASLTLKRGRTIGLTGSNGSGKTTLVHLLSRRYSLTHGRLSVDGSDAASIDIRSYRTAVAVVPETVKIFHGTLGENLALGLEGITAEELETRLSALAVGSFTGRFKDGLATLLGEDGRRLSAGERQMTGLIRALISGPSVLIIDEALNALDPRMYQTATRALAHHAERGATLLISHHPSVLALADERLLLNAGVITSATEVDADVEAA